MALTVNGKKKTKIELIAETSGSRTRTGMPTKRKQSAFPRIEPATVRKQPAVKKTSPSKANALLPIINRVLARASKLEEGSHLISYSIGKAKANELESIKQEAEEMRCWDLSDPKQYEKCYKKIMEADKRLQKLQGLP